MDSPHRLLWRALLCRCGNGMECGSVWHAGQLLAELAKRPQSQTHVEHPDQFRGIPPAASRHAQSVPMGHLRPAPQVQTRALREYDQFCGLEVSGCSLN
jgi:hypothetical protein